MLRIVGGRNEILYCPKPAPIDFDQADGVSGLGKVGSREPPPRPFPGDNHSLQLELWLVR